MQTLGSIDHVVGTEVKVATFKPSRERFVNIKLTKYENYW